MINQQITPETVTEATRKVINELSDFWKDYRTPQIPRVTDEISWIYREGGTVIDLGGSSGFHASICAVLGMRAICVDNFKVRGLGTVDDYFYKHDLEAEDCARKLGVEFIHTDLLTWSVPYAENSIDAVMSFDNLEHLHHSPRRTYQQLTRALREQGIFLLGGPNAANLLKRIRILFGGNVFSSLNEWYFHDKFIGHVREPVVDDFLEIAQDLNLHVEQIKGRNWLGYDKYGYNFTARLFDNFLRSRPSLCSDIYLLATKQP